MNFTKLENELIGIRRMAKKIKKYKLSTITLDIKLQETQKKLRNSKAYFFKKQS